MMEATIYRDKVFLTLSVFSAIWDGRNREKEAPGEQLREAFGH